MKLFRTPLFPFFMVRVLLLSASSAEKKKIEEIETGTMEWAALITGSKFYGKEDFAKTAEDHIVLQDYNDPVWFRNNKIRPLHTYGPIEQYIG